MGTRIFYVLAAIGLAALAGCSSEDLEVGATPTPVPTATTTSTPQPTASSTPAVVARRITSEAELLSGPLAHGRVGDYLLENAVARFVVQDVAKRDLWSVGQFGGNIIDAELRGHPGLDNFLEIQPAVNIETVLNAQAIEIVNDGSDGQAAIVRTCGPDDLLDFVNPSTILEDAGLPFPDSADDADYEIEGCTEYVLEPGVPYVQMVTTLFNNESTDLGLFVGDYINGAGELDQWTSNNAGLGEILTGPLGLLSYIGMDDASGVDYSLVPLPIAGSPIPGSSFFTAGGVTFLMQSNAILQILVGGGPTFVVPAGGSRSYTRYFGVGDGSGGNALDIENEVRGLATGTLRGCVTVGGRPAYRARVAVGLLSQERIARLVDILGTDAAGCYQGTVPPGSYGVAADQRGVPFEGGASTPLVHAVQIVAGQTVVQDIALPRTSGVAVSVRDATGAPVPARISVVGFDPSPEPVLTTPPLPGLGSTATGLFNDITKDALLFGLAAMDYTDAGGHLAFDLEPGSYQVYVSRGTEYSLYSQPITVVAGETVAVAARITHVLDTAGFISSDYHVHGINSADSRVSHRHRVQQFAGEGVDNVIMTDHHAHTDLNPVIDDLGYTAYVHATVGEEITTWDYGHFNAYPLLIDPSRPSGGSTDWAVGAPPGRDFPAYGAYGVTPAGLADLATRGPQSTPDTTIQINHISSFFHPLQIDTALVPPRSFLSPEGKLRFRIDPASGNLFHHFPALELWNGAGRSAQSAFLNERIGVWMNHLNQGLLTTAITDTDTHEFTNLNSAGGRTWTASPTDEPAEIDSADVARAVKAGKAIGSQGIYVQARLVAGDGSEAAADLTLAGTTLVRSASGGVVLEIRIQAPLWAPYDRIDVYANASTVVARSNAGVPTLYGAEPTLTLATPGDFLIAVTPVDEDVPGAARLETALDVPFADLAADTWFVVVVRGTDGVSRPMFPVFAHDLSRASNTTLAGLIDGNLGESGVMALGFTNALYADVDGEPGFQAPRAAP